MIELFLARIRPLYVYPKYFFRSQLEYPIFGSQFSLIQEHGAIYLFLIMNNDLLMNKIIKSMFRYTLGHCTV